MLLLFFLYVAHFYQSMTALITSNLIFQGKMGRVRCPQVSPDVTSARWEAETCIELVPGWRKGAGTSVHWPIPLLHWSTSPASCLPFLSFKQVSPIPPSFKTSCSVLVSLSVSFVPSVLARARRCRMTLSPIRKEKMDTKLRHICCFGRLDHTTSMV